MPPDPGLDIKDFVIKSSQLSVFLAGRWVHWQMGPRAMFEPDKRYKLSLTVGNRLRVSWPEGRQVWKEDLSIEVTAPGEAFVFYKDGSYTTPVPSPCHVMRYAFPPETEYKTVHADSLVEMHFQVRAALPSILGVLPWPATIYASQHELEKYSTVIVPASG